MAALNTLPPRVRRAMFVRSFAVQGSWNYSTLIGTGFAFVLQPALRYVYRGDRERYEEALARHAELFNSHPFLATLAAGAVARLESENAPPEVVARFKAALRGALGSLGDQLVWLSARPASALLGLVLLLAGLPWWAAIAVFLAVFNTLHITLRRWGLRTGLAHGIQVARVLREAPLQVWGSRLCDAGALLAGIAVALAATRGGPAGTALGWHTVLFAACAVAGWALGPQARRVAWGVLTLGWLAALFFGVFTKSIP